MKSGLAALVIALIELKAENVSLNGTVKLLETSFMHVAGGTDAAQFILANPNLQVAIIGHGNNTSHMVDEYVDKRAYLNSIPFFKEIVKEYLQ